MLKLWPNVIKLHTRKSLLNRQGNDVLQMQVQLQKELEQGQAIADPMIQLYKTLKCSERSIDEKMRNSSILEIQVQACAPEDLESSTQKDIRSAKTPSTTQEGNTPENS
jgi:hypothetical protein